MEGMDQALLEDFGQRIDLTRRIREVLVNYPEGTTVFKELIQNADDAGATTVRFCLDRRSHGVESLLSEKLRQWQGPALLAYNDAVFTEEDFLSICTIGDSKKQGQVWKTGRFGVGFNSVYHLTDLPSFVSDKYVVLFDPQGEYLPNVSSSNPGKRLDFVGSSALSYYKDQFSSYCAFGCDMMIPFRGTLFRFPLRSSAQAEVSKLSRQSYVEDDIISIFSQLYKEAVFAMLFLKNIISVEMYIWNSDANEPHKAYSCSIDSVNESLSLHRQTLQRISRSPKIGKREIDHFSLNFLRESFVGPCLERKTATFFIIQTMASSYGKIGAFAANAAKEYDIHLLPWASIATCMSDDTYEDDIFNEGQAFCFLPLPVKTGLRVQVNGYFEVSSNRRSIWYGDDMDRGGKLRSEWNKLLLEDVIAPLFCELLVLLSKKLDPGPLYYSLWPRGLFDVPWNFLVGKIYENAVSCPVVYSDIGEGRWLSPLEAFFHDLEFSKSEILRDALLSLEMPVASLPTSVVDMIFHHVPGLKERAISPHVVRRFLKKSGVLAATSRDHRLVLLEYSLSDLADIEVAKNTSGLQLLPLADGGFTSFSEASATPVFICDEFDYALLEGVSNQVIDRSISSDLFNRLTRVAKASSISVKVFKPQHLLLIFPRIFPAKWKYKSGILLDAHSDSNYPIAPWFRLFWQYLRMHCHDLSIFSDWPILPSTSGHLFRASEFSKLLNSKSLTDSLKNTLEKLGCKILDETYGVEHKELHLYVHEANGGGVMNAIFDVLPTSGDMIQTLFQVLSDEEKNELRSFLLDPKWYYEGIMDESRIGYCKRLPIYRVYGGASAAVLFSDLEIPIKYLPPSNVPELLLGDNFIFSSSNRDEEILGKYFGVGHMEKTVFYRENVFGRITELPTEICDQVMMSILQDLPQLCSCDSSFKEALSNLEFVPTFNGARKSPQSLYDPRVEEFHELLQDFDCFPHSSFQEPGILSMLQYLGLRTSVSAETIIQTARHIASLMRIDQMKACSQGKVLLSYLEVNSGKWVHRPHVNSERKLNSMLRRGPSNFKPPETRDLDLEKFWNDLKLISWCPVLVTPPFSSLPWPSVSSGLAPPRLVRLQADLWLVSASMRILDGDCSSSALASALGWSSPPSGSVITAQLLELGKNNELVSDQMLRQELAVAMPRIYSLLMDLIGSDEMDIIKAVLEGCRWIWVGDGFATVEEVVLSGHLHLAPFIRIIPVDLAAFKELFLEMGVQESLKPNDYANILCRMSRKKGSNPLDRHELNISVIIVQHLADVCHQGMHIQIYIPDASSRLFPSTDLLYNDAPWLLDPRDDLTSKKISKKDVYKFVHGSISNDVAEKLGVRSFRSILLAESSDSMKFSLYGVAEAFGQHEALTTRLKHIIEMYADGPGVLFELVQNAEDAGASEVNFLLDKTQYGTSSILSPEMADWQGPALYCFNDSVFSPQDLYAISRIGQDGKLEKPLSIGRFGLGFNCVYHFTDIPGFVSGENIVIFDPHASHLPGISPMHPGLRIKYVGKSILEQFPDQFAPFLHFGCDLHSPFPGTLFRFPLRNEVAASRSQIKREKYSPQDVLSLFSSFSDVVSEALLFLRNVKTISIFVKDGLDHEMHLSYRVSRLNVNEPDKELHPLHNLLDFVHGNPSNGLTEENFLERLGKTADRDLPWHCQKIAIAERHMSGENLHFWLVSECIGGGDAKEKSLLFARKSHNFIPWGCVAARLCSFNDKKVVDTLNSEGQIDHKTFIHHRPEEYLMQDSKEFTGRTFCFLPLPISTGLPVHLNAYFELSSNRRDLWFGDDMAGGGKIRSEWNISLLVNVIAPAYARFLTALASEIGPCDGFFSFWPTLVGTEPWNSLVMAVYKSISDLGLCVLYTRARGGQWISTRQGIFPDFSFPKGDALSEALSESGLPLITITKPIAERFSASCSSLHVLNPSLFRRLLIRRKREFQNKGAMLVMLEYCLSDKDGSVLYGDLYGVQLVPLSNGSFTTFKKCGEGERLFVVSEGEYNLLKNYLSHLLVDREVPEAIFEKLSVIAESGLFNLSKLTCQSLIELLPRILPPEWHYAKKVEWNPGQKDHPTVEWIQLLWSYLKSNCDDLSMFSAWPILPIGDSDLFQLISNSNIVRNEGWSENMTSLLQKIGCFFLRTDIQIQHPQLKNYVQDPTAPGILNAVRAIAHFPHDIMIIFEGTLEGEIHELRSFLLQSKWFSGNLMESHHVDMFKLLPLFETYRSRKFVSLTNPTKWLKPEGIEELLLDENFIRTESEREKAILNGYMDVIEPSKAKFYVDHFLHRMPDFLSQPSVLSSVIFDLKNLIDSDNSLTTVLAEYPFILSASGSWQCPSRLYDPRVPGLKKLLHNNYFPSEQFSNPEMLEILGFMGLRSNLNLGGLLDSARSISILNDSDDPDALIYGKRFLSCLCAASSILSSRAEILHSGNLSVLDQENDSTTEVGELDSKVYACLGDFSDESEDELWLELRKISWCPVLVQPPMKGVPWVSSKTLIASPDITRPKSQMWMVSSRMRILDCECSSNYVQRRLGWLDNPDIGVLCSQLMDISIMHQNLESDSEERTFFDSQLQREIPVLCSKLQQHLGSDDFKIAETYVKSSRWVWVGDSFVSSCALAFDSPIKYPPYLYVVPSELSEFRPLLLALGVRLTFTVTDYLHVLQQLHHDLKSDLLSPELLDFVLCVLESIADCPSEKSPNDDFLNSLLVPNSSGSLTCASDVVYNDAPWMEKSFPDKIFAHPSIREDLAKLLGLKSLRSLSFVDDEMTKDVPCMGYSKISELLRLYGDHQFLLSDILELADCCEAKKVHIIYDKREHPRQSLLQHNLGEFQGPGLLAVIEGAALSREELCSLQLSPPWKLRGATLHYGLGFLSCHSVSDLLSIVSCGYLYMFDPLGVVFSSHPNTAPSAKMFSLIGNDLTKKFHDQFHPMLLHEHGMFSAKDSMIIRMPLSSRLEENAGSCSTRIQAIFDEFINHASSTMLFLKSVLKVSLSTWEPGSPTPSLDYSVSIDPTSATLRNPFSEKKWKKFHISRLFNSSNATTKSRVMDLQVFHRGEITIDKWLVVHSLGSGQTRNMALDRRYLAYNLTPVGGVAALVSQNGLPVNPGPLSSILSPLGLSQKMNLPVTVMGCFLLFHNGGRYLFNKDEAKAVTKPHLDSRKQLVEAWNKELMLCVRDSYMDLVLELQKLQGGSANHNNSDPLSSIISAYSDNIYSFWPRTPLKSSPDVNEADCECVIQNVIRPFYERVIDLPVWRLYRGDLVKANEGMFLSQTSNDSGSGLPPSSVCGFIKEHYPVFSVPSDLVSEILAVGFKVREIKPPMVRSLLKASRSVTPRSIDVYLDVLDYCVSDIQLLLSSDESEAESSDLRNLDNQRTLIPTSNNNQGGDALEIVSSFGRALYDFGCGVVEDITRSGNLVQDMGVADDRLYSRRTLQSIGLELKGLPFPTTNKNLSRLGNTELWIGTKDQQSLMRPLLEKFIDPRCLEHPALSSCLLKRALHGILKLEPFSPYLLSRHLRSIFSESWASHVLESNRTPWISWEKKSESSDCPSPEWIKLFWKTFNALDGDLSLVSNWPFIPAFLNRSILCRVRESNLVFIPPVTETERSDSESDNIELFVASFELTKSRYPWLFLLLNRCNIPVYDMEFSNQGAPNVCFPPLGQSLGREIASKILASTKAGYFSVPETFSQEDRDRLFELFISDFRSSTDSPYKSEEIDVLRALPIYKTTIGSYTSLSNDAQCLIPSDAFFHPKNAVCLSCSDDESSFYRSLRVDEINNLEILIRFALPGFEDKTPEEQGNILKYLYMNWEEIQLDNRAVDAIKESRFVRNANEHCFQLFKPRDLLDPCDPLLMSVFSDERDRFPGERFTSDGWLRILKKTALRTSSEAYMLLECARKLEIKGKEAMKHLEDNDGDAHSEIFTSSKGISSEQWALTESVVETIFANLAVLYDNSFCGSLSTIAFVPAEKGFPNIGGKRGGKRVFCAFNEAILSKDWPLAWSCSPILVRENVVPPDFARGALRFRSPPLFSTVIKHLQIVGKNNGEDVLAHWPASMGMMTVDESCSVILKYLDSIWRSLSSSDIEELQKVAFIPVANGTRLVNADSLFVRLTVNVSPFAFELPNLYLPFVKILKELGIRDLLSPSYAKDLLLNIQRSCGYQRLNPNELRAVVELIYFICNDETHSSRSSESEWFHDAIIPDDGCRLVAAKSCVYIDVHGSKFLSCIDTSMMRFVHPQIPERMCLSLGVKKLSDVVIEDLEEQHQLVVQDEIGEVPLERMREKLQSKTFSEALWLTINTSDDRVPLLEGLTLENLQSTLQVISHKVQFVKHIYTRFLLLPKRLDITKKGATFNIPEWETTRHRTTHFVDKSTTRILVAEPASYISVYDIMAAIVSEVLGLAIGLPIGPLFSCPLGSEKSITSVLKMGSQGKVGQKKKQTLGEELLPQDALQVQFYPLRPFYAGEIVAWRIHKDGEKLKYGRVVNDVRPSSGQPLYRFAVETAVGRTQSLLSSQVFSFRSVSMMSEKVEESTGDSPQPTTFEQPVQEITDFGRVSAAEMIHAVHEMLSASGINMDAEKRALMQMNLTLQEQLRESEAALLVEQEKADSAVKEADVAKAAWVCRICLGAEVEVVTIPCGHVLCRRCSSAVSRCPFCRVQVTRTVKIFRP